jgi:hypothetical protein
LFEGCLRGDLIQIAAPAFRKAAKQENEMKKLNCKPCDLAIIIDAYNSVNIGAIVRITATHKKQNALDKEADDHLWTVIAPHPLTYAINGKLVTKRRGPAPDSALRPIRGITELADIAVKNFKQEIYKEFGRRQARLSPKQVQEKLTQRRSEFIKTMSQG